MINNIFNVSLFDGVGNELFRERYNKTAEYLPKLRTKIKFIAGDPYYELMDFKEFTMKNNLYPEPGKELHCFADIDEWLEDNMHDMMPTDGPQSRFYC